MSSKKTLSNREAIEEFVNTFYGRVQQDELIGPIFNKKLEGRWPEHLDKMYRFWETILTEKVTYQGRPFPPHLAMDLHTEHFERWLGIFLETISDYEGPEAEEAWRRANMMASTFLYKIEHFRDPKAFPIQ
ncbi:MAG: group III truncated hemoglobin [Bacteroidota bacterium]|nr:group III truncated hemoglobin [Bacteroidota bacterium]MDX5430442.1 group III truncated hemoglobin [Bacteroidota bacterium]MDX5469201.1 group III truncated hemoglobin [Bacteroidota bacterium]